MGPYIKTEEVYKPGGPRYRPAQQPKAGQQHRNAQHGKSRRQHRNAQHEHGKFARENGSQLAQDSVASVERFKEMEQKSDMAVDIKAEQTSEISMNKKERNARKVTASTKWNKTKKFMCLPTEVMNEILSYFSKANEVYPLALVCQGWKISANVSVAFYGAEVAWTS